MPRPGQKTVTLSTTMYDEVQRIVSRHRQDFESVADYVKHAIVELNMRMRATPKK